jgi:hypothetical protein
MPVRGELLDRRWIIALLSLAAAIPLVWPQIPPLIDLPGHMGRFHIARMLGEAPTLTSSFSFEWKLVGNLGLDLLIVPLASVFGVELGTKLIVLAIPPLTVAGMLLAAREAHGRVPAMALFALPLAWPFPFHFGFINFSLSIALAWLVLALWMRLGRTKRLVRRALLFAIISCALWLTHMVGWGLFGLAAFGTELVRRHRAGESLVQAGFRSGLACAPLALPLIPTLLLRSDSPETISFDWFNWDAKLFWISSLLRDRWQGYDLLCAWTLVLIVAVAAIRRRAEPMMAVPALLCLVAFILMPRVAVGSAYADMRLLPFTLGLALLAIRAPQDWAKPLMAIGLTFFLVRLGATTASLAFYNRQYRDELRALDRLPQNASVLSLVVRPCGNAWSTERLDHLPALAIIRRNAFTNDQWIIASASGLRVIRPGVGVYGSDPSQLIYPQHCRGEGSGLEKAITEFNRAAFNHVWVIGGQATAPDLQPLWSNGRSTLYRVAGQRGSE